LLGGEHDTVPRVAVEYEHAGHKNEGGSFLPIPKIRRMGRVAAVGKEEPRLGQETRRTTRQGREARRTTRRTCAEPE